MSLKLKKRQEQLRQKLKVNAERCKVARKALDEAEAEFHELFNEWLEVKKKLSASPKVAV